MHLRKDAGSALIHCCHNIIQRFERVRGPDSVWNFGVVSFAPGAGNVVPSITRMLVEFRDPTTEILDRIEAEIQTAIGQADGQNGVSANAEKLISIPPADMDAEIAAMIESAAYERHVPVIRMPSGAGHDARVLTKYVPTAMLFIPSIGGRSHDVAEDTDERDICLGAEVMADTVQSLAEKLASRQV
jgi:N-carbamoyl-L-amino-acid hydrolase